MVFDHILVLQVNGTSKKKAPVIAYDDDDAMPSPPRKKKRKSVMKAMDLPNDPAVTINNEEALRLEQIRAQALQAFKDDDEDDDGDDGEEADHEEAENRPSAPIRPIGMQRALLFPNFGCQPVCFAISIRFTRK